MHARSSRCARTHSSRQLAVRYTASRCLRRLSEFFREKCPCAHLERHITRHVEWHVTEVCVAVLGQKGSARPIVPLCNFCRFSCRLVPCAKCALLSNWHLYCTNASCMSWTRLRMTCLPAQACPPRRTQSICFQLLRRRCKHIRLHAVGLYDARPRLCTHAGTNHSHRHQSCPSDLQRSSRPRSRAHSTHHELSAALGRTSIVTASVATLTLMRCAHHERARASMAHHTAAPRWHSAVHAPATRPGRKRGSQN